MKNHSKFYSIPSVRFAAVLLFEALIVSGAIYLACLENKFAFTLQSDMNIKSVNGEMQIEKIDLISEPGDIPGAGGYYRFFERQDKLANIINTDVVTVTNNGNITEYKAEKKNLGDLPLLFWIQIVVAVSVILIPGWIWALKPKNLPTSFFAFSGFFLGMSVVSSSVYTTRFIAIPENIFRPLSLINAWCAPLFGLALIGLFLISPKEVKHWKKIWFSAAVLFLSWTTACSIKWIFCMQDISVLIVLMVVALASVIGVQFYLVQKDPKGRAILTWLGLSILLGCGAFIGFNTIPVLLGLQPLQQGYAFIPFLFVNLGIAFGLRQYRLFDIGDWAFKFLFYALGTLLLVALDALLIYVAQMSRFPALGLAIGLVGFCYLPLRDYFQKKFYFRNEMQPHEILSESLSVTLAPTSAIRLHRWESLIKKLYDPLEMNYSQSQNKNVILENDGVALVLPAVADIPSLRIAYPWSGSSLFSTRALETAKQIVKFIEEAESSRRAYDRGVIEERLRIAQDLHDDVGARLLTGLHSDGADLRSTIQGAMADIRSIVKGIAGEKVLLGELLADLRSESYKRLGAVNIELKWNVPEIDIYEFAIDYHLHKTLGSVFREIISNTIKHAQAKKIEITVNIVHERLQIFVADDGHGFPEKVIRGQTGFGLKSMRKRISDLGGKFEIKNSPYASITIDLPIIQ